MQDAMLYVMHPDQNYQVIDHKQKAKTLHSQIQYVTSSYFYDLNNFVQRWCSISSISLLHSS